MAFKIHTGKLWVFHVVLLLETVLFLAFWNFSKWYSLLGRYLFSVQKSNNRGRGSNSKENVSSRRAIRSKVNSVSVGDLSQYTQSQDNLLSSTQQSSPGISETNTKKNDKDHCHKGPFTNYVIH